jgi:hypothetical protein
MCFFPAKKALKGIKESVTFLVFHFSANQNTSQDLGGLGLRLRLGLALFRVVGSLALYRRVRVRAGSELGLGIGSGLELVGVTFRVKGKG